MEALLIVFEGTYEAWLDEVSSSLKGVITESVCDPTELVRTTGQV